MWFLGGAVFWGAAIAALIWLFTRKKADGKAVNVGAADVPQSKARVDNAEPDERLWAQAMAEFEGELRRDGLWAKSLARAQGDQSRAQAIYLEDRVSQLKNEAVEVAREQALEREVERQEQLKVLSKQRSMVEAARARFLAGQPPTAADLHLLVSAAVHDRVLMSLTDRQTGQSLLHWAVRLNLPLCAAQLLKHGANPDLRNGQGRRALDEADEQFLLHLQAAQSEA